MGNDTKPAATELVERSTSLIAALRNPHAYPHPVGRIDVLETHISWVLLTGEYAYKIKKPVSLGFLDFRTLEQRLACCRDELRLNRRLAPRTYLDVIAITGSPEQPCIGGAETAIEYAVKMVQFDQDMLASRILKNGALTAQHIEGLATTIAKFHARASTDRPNDSIGSSPTVLSSAMQNFDQIQVLPGTVDDRAVLNKLRTWTQRNFDAHRDHFELRGREDRVRECHGDLHLGNVALIDGELTPFDCIEFSADLRWIDVASEVAFLVMDLIDRGRPDLAFLFLSAYLELTGDYGSVRVMRFYLVYRAMVRAKVHCLRAHQLQPESSEYRRLLKAYRDYLALAERFTRPRPPSLVILHGLSGSGKSTVGRRLLQAVEAIEIRSDVERKRMCDVDALGYAACGIENGIYTVKSTERVYRRLADLAREIAGAGYNTVVDATFLKRWQRELLRDRARELKVPFIIAAIQCPEQLLRERIIRRQNMGSDASDADLAVLSYQTANQDPIAASEKDAVVTLNGALSPEALSGTHAWHDLISRVKQ